MMSSSRCTVAAVTGASTHWPFCSTWRAAVTRSASARRSRSRITAVTLTRSDGVCGLAYHLGTMAPAIGIGLGEGREREGLQRRAPQIGIDADRRHLAGGDVGMAHMVVGGAAEGAADVVANELAAGKGHGAGGGQADSGYAEHRGSLETKGAMAVIDIGARPASTGCAAL